MTLTKNLKYLFVNLPNVDHRYLAHELLNLHLQLILLVTGHKMELKI